MPSSEHTISSSLSSSKLTSNVNNHNHHNNNNFNSNVINKVISQGSNDVIVRSTSNELKLREAKRRSIILYFNKDKTHFLLLFMIIFFKIF